MTTANRAFRRFEATFTDGPAFRLTRCACCAVEVETVDSHTRCDECAAAVDAADERQERLDRADDEAELSAWSDALRAEAIEHQCAADLAAERALPHRAAA
jgi:hypothetical protein